MNQKNNKQPQRPHFPTKEAFRKECDRRRAQSLALHGKRAYPIRAYLRELGAIWDKKRKAWLLPDRQALLNACGKLRTKPTPTFNPSTYRRQGFINCANCGKAGATKAARDQNGTPGYVCIDCHGVPSRQLDFGA